MENRNEDIVFVINPSLWGQNMYPSGILCLSGFLEGQGYPNVILDSRLVRSLAAGRQEREAAVLARIRECRPRLVCFSSTHREFGEVVRLNAAVKAIDPSVTVIVGGAQPTYRASDFLENGFDFACIGEGEKTLHEFCAEVFSGRRAWNSVRGLCWNDRGAMVLNPARELMAEEELNAAGVLPYERIDPRYFDMNLMAIRGLPLKGALLLTTRGCPFSCSYCGCNLIFGRKLRFRSLACIEREVAYLKARFGIEGVWIVDDTFTVNKGHCLAVAQVLKRYGLVWGCQSRVDTIDDGMMSAMRACGCAQIDFGVESGSQRILDDIIGKRITIPQVRDAFRLARKHGVRTLANFMVGLPTETYGDLAETHRIAEEINADAYIFSIATPLPGTRLYGMVNEKISPHEYAQLDWNGSALTGRLNKSRIRDLIAEKDRLYRKFLGRMLVKSLVSGGNYRFFLRNKNKYARCLFALKALYAYAGKLRGRRRAPDCN